MPAVIMWKCKCELHYKALFSSAREVVAIHCCRPGCDGAQSVEGKITQLFVQSTPDAWQHLSPAEFVDPPPTAPVEAPAKD